jgi:pentatricopeptide repeat protein
MNPKKAKKALRLSLDTGQNPYAYNALAEIYCQENKMDSAWQMYEKASKTDKLSLRVSILKSMADIRAKQGRYKEANELNAQALALKDSLLAQQRGEDLRGRQEQIEQSESLEELVRENRYWIVVAGLLMVLLIAFSFYYSKRKRRAKQLQLQLLEEIEQKRMELENVRISKENASDQVDKLTRELKTLEKRYTERIQTGEQLYDELLAGGNTVQWSKHDYDVFIQYSKLKNTKLVKQIEADYAPLSPRYMTCAILHHMGKSDEEIKQALAVSDSSLRSIKTRIKAKKKIVNAASA